ncbi:hypothetical protein [Mesorhizobium sp. 113-3-3]|uniref:hypothetical protein n=1 Tax=Mesorhizobium sp. 113-3-3 TaxID=2744516 RepID=UPI0018EB448A|nr:hypothetical protein [Mesorhizobium sp. 113-3-3]BCG83512.1 hypothetical protein MesoLj113b_70540 [Mesorhizobium sp. 113-3-3]
MKTIMGATVALVTIFAGSTAIAAVPVSDGPILSQRSEDKADKVQIKLIQEDTKSATQGVNCSVTTPKKAQDVKSPKASVDPASGRASLEQANPDIKGSSAFASTGSGSGAIGGNAGERSLLDSTGQVLGGMNGSMSTVAPNRQSFETMGQDIGTDKTVMEAFDRNSGIRAQGGLTFNEVIQATGFFAQAFNVRNIGTATLTSRGSSGLVVPTPPPPPSGSGGATSCPGATSGGGTAGNPCCSSTDSACTAPRTTDTVENVSPMLSQIQRDANSAPVTMTTDELMSAVKQYQAQ